jgi:uncharacterized cupin superfamily protein
MKIAKLSSIPEERVGSPKGKYQLVRQSISQALGGIKNVGTWGGGHPFDVEQVRIAPGAANIPFHAHAAQWEMYVFTSGQGEVRGDDGVFAIQAGDSVIFSPGQAHQIRNTGTDELIYLVIADHPVADIATYPDTPGKLVTRPGLKPFTMNEVSYYEPEE